MHRHVRRDAGQDLVTGDQHLQFRAVQAGVLGRVPAADHHTPGVRADAQLLAVAQAPIAVRERVDVLAEVAETRTVGLDRRRAPAGTAAELDGIIRRLAAGVGHHDAAAQVLQPRHPQANAELARQPAGHADMVGMHVGDEHARQRALVGRVREQLAPDEHRLLVAHAGVDDGPPLAIVERPQVDVIQRIGQRHPDPVHAWRHLEGLPAWGWSFERVGQGGLGLVASGHARSERIPGLGA